MPRIISTVNLNWRAFDRQQQDYIYNGIDCGVTAEVLDALRPKLTPATAAVYAFVRSSLGPALTMQLRGMRVNEVERKRNIAASSLVSVRSSSSTISP